MGTYRKRPVVVEAMQLHDDLRAHTAIAEWITSQGGKVTIPALDPHLTIHTLEGDMRADLGDWIIRGVQGEFYPCKPDIFDATYEPAETPTQAPEARLGSSPRAQGLADLAGEIVTELEGYIEADHRSCGPSPLDECTYRDCVSGRGLVEGFRRRIGDLAVAEGGCGVACGERHTYEAGCLLSPGEVDDCG